MAFIVMASWAWPSNGPLYTTLIVMAYIVMASWAWPSNGPLYTTLIVMAHIVVAYEVIVHGHVTERVIV